MQQQKETDRQLVENLIATRNFDAFIQRFKGDIFKAIEMSYRKFDKNAELSLSQKEKEQLMYDFIELLLDDNAKRFQGYLHQKGYKVKNYTGKKNKFVLASSGDFIGDKSVPDLKQVASLDHWLMDQYSPFFDSKVIVNGILSHNTNVIQTFFFSNNPPGCRNFFESWIRRIGVFTMEALEEVDQIQSKKENKEDSFEVFVDREIQEYINKLYVDIEKEKEERGDCYGELLPRRKKQESYEKAFLTPIQSYKFKENFYDYFNEYVLRPYFFEKYFSGSDSNPDSTSIIYDDSENDDEEYDTPPHNIIQLGVFREPTRKHDIQNLLERIFRVMEQTKTGKRQVQALKKRLSLMKMGLTDFEVDIDVAEEMDMTLEYYRVFKHRTKASAVEIIKKYFKTEYDILLSNEKHG